MNNIVKFVKKQTNKTHHLAADFQTVTGSEALYLFFNSKLLFRNRDRASGLLGIEHK